MFTDFIDHARLGGGPVRVDLASAPGDVVLAATGSVVTFDGFLRIYREGRDDDAVDDVDAQLRLPAMMPGERVFASAVHTTRRFTPPPPRYTEAGLVRTLEERGIGRPSTYAATVGVLREREYVVPHKRRFVATERGRVVTAFLEAFFARWVACEFTAGLEQDLDRIAGGGLAWKGVLHAFWGDFDTALKRAGALERRDIRAAIEGALEGFAFGRAGESGQRPCPSCPDGQLSLKIGRFGPWLRHGRTYVSIPYDDDVLTIGLNRAVMLIAEKEG